MVPGAESFLSHAFEALFNNSRQNCVLLINQEGIITDVNEAFSLCFGYPKSEIVGKNLAVLFTEEDRQKKLPENEVARVLRTGQSSDNNYMVNNDKSITWVSGESLRVKNKEDKTSIIKVIQNIQKQKSLQTDLSRANDFNEEILRSIEDVVIVLNDKMEVIKGNNAFYNLFKKVGLDVSEMNFAEIMRPYDIKDHLLGSIRDTIAAKKSFLNTQIELNTATGDKKIFVASLTLLQNAGDDNVLLILHDITINKQVEREREDIIGFIAHELRNPLANIVLCNEIMGEAIKRDKMEEVMDMLQRSKNNVMRLHKMIGELYDSTTVNSGNLRLEISSFNFSDMVKEAIDTIKVLQPAYNIIVKGDGNVQVSGDKYKLIQVITNYLSNGIKYSDGKTDVILHIQHTGQVITVSVKDQGLGISKEQLPYIFDRFFRAEKTRNIEGIGLGLYLCRQIIHAHNGKVWAESVERKGSTFYFSIPTDFTD